MASGNHNGLPNGNQLGLHNDEQAEPRQRVNKANINVKKPNKNWKASSKSNDRTVYRKNVNGDEQQNLAESASSSMTETSRSYYSDPTTVQQDRPPEWSKSNQLDRRVPSREIFSRQGLQFQIDNTRDNKAIENNNCNASSCTVGPTKQVKVNHEDSGSACSLVTSSLRPSDNIVLKFASNLKLRVPDNPQANFTLLSDNEQFSASGRNAGHSKSSNFQTKENKGYTRGHQRRVAAESNDQNWGSANKFENRGGISDNKMFYAQNQSVDESEKGTFISAGRERLSNSNNGDFRNNTHRDSANWTHENKTYGKNQNRRLYHESYNVDRNRTSRNQRGGVERKRDKYSGASNVSSAINGTLQVKQSTSNESFHTDVVYSSRESRPIDEFPRQGSVTYSNLQIRCVANDTQRNTDTSNSVETLTNGKDCVQLPNDCRSSKSCRVKQEFRPTSCNIADESQRGSLIDQLFSNTYECMVCCGVVRKDTAVWGCQNCYHMFHLYCVKKWASTPTALLVANAVAGWRCPACQNVCQRSSTQYVCFCGKLKDPPYSRHFTPHSCGELCGKVRSVDCVHRCNILCHPGPCPPCEARVTRSCLCGKGSKSMKCSDIARYQCGTVCDKKLNCGKHSCDVVCHIGPCSQCAELVVQTCSCSSSTRSVLCGSVESSSDSFSCEKVCGKKLACGNHSCTAMCHSGLCGACVLLPSALLRCACGQTNIADIKKAVPRLSCTDKQTTCRRVCDKLLKCGNADRPHRCKHKCHIDKCPPCDGVTQVDCRCGALSQTMSCAEALSFIAPLDNTTTAHSDGAGTVTTPVYCCTRRCNKKMSCSRHKCAQMCCTSTDHICKLICGYKLSCDLHKCEEMCHRGNCNTCWHVSFDELYCDCGGEVIYPPVPCGTKPPDCPRPCMRAHDCAHEVLHTCHSEDQCPPCTVLTSKHCMGDHELRHNIPCYLKNISCGRPCNKLLPCQQHKCLLICHKDECLSITESCVQSCPLKRQACGHACLELCHHGSPCPNTPCKAEVVLSCECRQRQEKTICRQINVHIEGNTDDCIIPGAERKADVVDNSERSIDVSKKLPCNAECAKYLRKQRLALRLQIKNPNLSDKLGTPSYSQFLKDLVKQNTAFVVQIEDDLSQLVISAHQRKSQPTRTHAFKCMPYAQRRTIHELAEFYGCTTESFDEEPNKNVVATAVRDRCWHPNTKLTQFLHRKFIARTTVPILPKYEYIWSDAETAMLSFDPEGVASVVTKDDISSDITIAPDIDRLDQLEIESVN